MGGLVTTVLRRLPASMRSVLLRKATAIADDRTRFQNGYPGMFGSLGNLRDAGFHPKGVVDVGANKGSWTYAAAAIFPEARFHMIEAQPELSDCLDAVTRTLRARAGYTIALLGRERSEAVPFHTLGSGSSVFEELTDLQKGLITLPMVRLDDVPEVAALPKPLLIKLDVQGYELEVLKGAEQVLANADVVLMEVSLLPFNKRAPLIAEVIAYMHERGYVAYDICSQKRRASDRALFQMDVIFAREDSRLRMHRRFSRREPK